jgi:hypothetical protein
MSWQTKTKGGILAVIGYLLSPLSWWNDAFVNLPLALAFGWLIALFYKPAFEPAVVFGYWLTNVLGFVLMHKGGRKILSSDQREYSRRDLFRDVLVSLAYTLFIIALLKGGILKPVENYFHQ